MFAFVRQVQLATDQAKNGAARLVGVEPPRYEDNETTIEQLKTRIDDTIGYLETLDPFGSTRPNIARSYFLWGRAPREA